MPLETIFKIDSILKHKSSTVFFAKTLLFIITFFSLSFPILANAACCICQHPQVITGIVCISKENTSCTNLGTLNDELKPATCKTENNDSACRLVKDGGICVNNPNTTAAAFKLSEILPQTPAPAAPAPPAPATEFKPVLVNLNIAIPGAEFSNPTLQQGMLSIPYLGQYIQAFYKLLIGISLIAAAIMIVYGGFRYIASATTPKIQAGKQIIIDALMGLVIVIGAYIILANVNPNLTQFGSLTLPFVKPEEIDLGNYTGTEPMGTEADVNFAGSDATKDEIKQMIIKASKELGVNPCIMLAICTHETGLRSIWSGYPKSDKYNAVAYGPCQIHKMHLFEGAGYTGYWAKKARSRFSNFPSIPADQKMTKEEQNERLDWALNNPQGSIWIAVNIYKSLQNITGNNDLLAVSSYGSGYASIKNWMNKTKCKPKPMSIQQAVSLNLEEALRQSCIPKSVTIAKSQEECASDNYICANMKADTKAVLIGHCPSDNTKKCVGMNTGKFASFIYKVYPQYNAQYQCSN